MRRGDGDELLGLYRQGAVGEDPLVEGREGVVDFRRQLRRCSASPFVAGGKVSFDMVFLSFSGVHSHLRDSRLALK